MCESHLFNLCALVLGEIGIQKLNTDQALGLHFWNNGSDIRKENQGEGLRLNVALVAQQTLKLLLRRQENMGISGHEC